MPRGIDDVDPVIAIADCCVFGQDGNPTLPFEGIGVHDLFDNLLIVPEDTALLEHDIDQGGFAMVDVGNDGNVAQGLDFS